MHGKTHKGQTIHSCTHCEFSANTSQQLDDHMNTHRGTRPFQCSECGLMFAARADLRAHVTRTHRTLSTTMILNSSGNRPQRRATSLQTRTSGISSVPEDDEQHDDEYRCLICQRQFTSARLLDRHTYAVHEPKQDSYDDRDYHADDMADHHHQRRQQQDDDRMVEDGDDVHDYADDELEEKERENFRLHVKSEHEQLDSSIDEPMHTLIEHDNDVEVEDDLASDVEDIIDNDDDFDRYLPTIKSVSTASRKQLRNVKKFNEQDEPTMTHRKCHINRGISFDEFNIQ
jgi:uncharacterized Zn-finger protein